MSNLRQPLVFQPLDLSSLAPRLKALRTSQRTRQEAYRPDIVAGSLVVQAGELRGALHDGVDSEALGLRVAEMLCDLVQFADVANVDMAEAVERHVSRSENRLAGAGQDVYAA
jgi:NTP pyrophosphatase (non-canonical NTP hydrolase)